MVPKIKVADEIKYLRVTLENRQRKKSRKLTTA
jgi:hypothetical protein